VIEVEQDEAGGWRWSMVSGAGRLLVYRTGYATANDAVASARCYRVAFLAYANRCDHRQGACV
jgi:hypothetical protein